jgi:cytochrome c553
MIRRSFRRAKGIALIVLVTIICMLLLAALFMASGLYNVAASERHFTITSKLIAFTLRRSVTTHSLFVETAKRSDHDLVPLGANHFASACAPCHGSPTEQRNPVALNMAPEPPPLRDAGSKWTPEQLFWIVKHGLKYTGMPAWPGEGRDDEVWAVVAFLLRLPDIDQTEYRRLVGAAGRAETLEHSKPIFADPRESLSRSCSRCHGTAGGPPVSRRVPALHSQSAAYLERALEEYRNGTRSSGFMEPIAAALTANESRALAEQYAKADPIPGASIAEDPASFERGRSIAHRGVRESGIPPCLACHSGRASRQFPILGGLSAEYMKGQLSLWRKGLRNRTAYGAIMAVIANRLNEEQIRDVTLYLDSLRDKRDTPAQRPGEESE